MSCKHATEAGSYYNPIPWVDCDLTGDICEYWIGKDECENEVNEA